MTDALIHLSSQPEGWPKWQRSEDLRQHLFVFLARTEKHGTLFGHVRPACWWSDGATNIEYQDPPPLNYGTPEASICHACMEAELQHGLREFGTM